ncbi:MAG: MazG nucleotide pyrophosphohydrolase domain-containing protein [bacterium]|nr:MazG nucleotide pyrophosphohydrolase domain-containing protein [bacterium]
MKKLTLNQAIKETIKVASKFPNKKEWQVHNNFAAMVEEVGELANAIQVEEGFKSKKRKKSEIADSICDILYELFRIAKWYKIDLDKKYPLVSRLGYIRNG